MTMPGISAEEIRNIGFNDPVERDGRHFHVQTEVLARDTIAIRTTILEAGLVRFAESRAVQEVPGDFDRFSALVAAQHDHYVRELKRTGETWLASISRTK